MRNPNNDPRRQRKAAQRRRQTIMLLALFGALCFVVTITWFSINYVRPAAQTAIPATFTVEPANPPDVETSPLDPSPLPTLAELLPTFTPMATAIPALTDSQQSTSPQVNERLAGMSLAQKAGQMILMGVGGKEITPGVCAIIQEVMPGGIVFDGSNVSDANQLRRFISDLRDCAGKTSQIPLFFAIDHEGQYINRFKSGDMTVFPSAQALGATGNPRYAFDVALASGQELSSVGINMVLGPDADVLTNANNTVIGERSFGGDPQRVGQFVVQAVQGYQQAGLVPVLKHFPGHGASDTDSHEGLPVDDATFQSLLGNHFPPFSQGINAGAGVVMMGHIALPQIDSSNFPASLSAPIVGLLRRDLGFNGVIVTDSLEMGALQSTGLDASGIALTSVKAGVDMLLILSATNAQIASSRIQQVAGQDELFSARVNDSARRILSLKEKNDLLAGEYPPMYSNPDFRADQALADDVGSHAVAILKNTAGLIPIPAGNTHVLVIAPPDAWGLHAALSNALESKGFVPKIVTYPAPWADVVGTDAMLQSLTAQASNADLTIVLTWQAHTNRVLNNDNWQGRLVRAIQQSGASMVVVGLKSPTDILEFPEITTFIATFGTTPGQVQALADILCGNRDATGVNPLPKLLP